jgi:hypothetical protein
LVAAFVGFFLPAGRFPTGQPVFFLSGPEAVAGWDRTASLPGVFLTAVADGFLREGGFGVAVRFGDLPLVAIS